MIFEIRDIILLASMLVGFGVQIGMARVWGDGIKRDFERLHADVESMKNKIHNGMSIAITEIKKDIEHLREKIYQ